MLRARELAVSAGKPVAVDANLRPGRWADLELALGLLRSLCPEARLVKLNVEEARLLTELNDPEAAADALCALGARLAVVTLGAKRRARPRRGLGTRAGRRSASRRYHGRPVGSFGRTCQPPIWPMVTAISAPVCRLVGVVGVRQRKGVHARESSCYDLRLELSTDGFEAGEVVAA